MQVRAPTSHDHKLTFSAPCLACHPNAVRTPTAAATNRWLTRLD